jgi:hypothetical protein
MITTCTKEINAYWTPTICVYQWDVMCGNDPSHYMVVTKNIELARMQGVKPGCAHIECIVDDMGNLRKAA